MRRRGTSRSGTCTVASTTRSVGEWNIIATSDTPHRCASRSVWPFQPRPAAAKAALLTGAVATACTTPLRASFTARTMASKAARPAWALIWPIGTGEAGVLS